MKKNEAQNQTPRIWGNEEKSDCGFNPNSNSRTGSASTVIGNQPQRSNREGGETANIHARRKQNRLGGILSQLEELQEEYIAYVEAHENRLNQRLAEDKRVKAQVRERVSNLRNRIIEELQQDSAELET